MKDVIREDIMDQFGLELSQEYPVLRGFARKLTASGQASEDLVQETLLRAWAARDSFTPGTNLRGWLCTILFNRFRHDFRKNKLRNYRSLDDAEHPIASMGISGGQLETIELNETLEAIGTLRGDMQEALLAVGLEGETYEEAAKRFGTVAGTMKSRTSRARALLAQRTGSDRYRNGR